MPAPNIFVDGARVKHVVVQPQIIVVDDTLLVPLGTEDFKVIALCALFAAKRSRNGTNVRKSKEDA